MLDRHHASPPRPPRRCKQRYGQAQHSAFRLNMLHPPAHLRSVTAKCDRIFEIFHILARYFHETCVSLNFLAVHSCSQKPSSDKLYVCVEVSTKTDTVMLNFYPSNTGHWSNISTQYWTNIGVKHWPMLDQYWH